MSVLEISFLGIHQSEPDIYNIGLSPALHLQCSILLTLHVPIALRVKFCTEVVLAKFRPFHIHSIELIISRVKLFLLHVSMEGDYFL